MIDKGKDRESGQEKSVQRDDAGVKFERGMNGKWRVSLTTIEAIERAVKDGIPIRVGKNPVRGVKPAVVDYVYNNAETQERFSKENVSGWLVDLGTDGVAGHGYDGEEHFYFCPDNTVYSDCVMFQCPANLREGDWKGDGVEVIEEGETVEVPWSVPTVCGCII